MCLRRLGIWYFVKGSRRRNVIRGLCSVSGGKPTRYNIGTWGTRFRVVTGLILIFGMFCGNSLRAQESANPDAPAVEKVEPPNWWVGLTPDVMLLLSGRNLRATHVSCNLRDVVVSRTQ